jgi:hypothetical protein
MGLALQILGSKRLFQSQAMTLHPCSFPLRTGFVLKSSIASTGPIVFPLPVFRIRNILDPSDPDSRWFVFGSGFFFFQQYYY